MARGTSRIGTRRMAMAADMDQKPPNATPSKMRAVSSMAKFDAKAEMRFEMMRAMLKAHITWRRSMPLVKMAMVGAAMAPMMAVAVTAWPAAPTLMPRSAASGVSRLTGR